MKITLSVIKADVGSIGGHIAPSRRLVETVAQHVGRHGAPLVVDSQISHTGDDIAILMTHRQGAGDPLDCFAHPFWNTVRDRVAGKAIGMRRQGFFGAAMLPMSELEYTGIVEELKSLDKRFVVRPEKYGRA
jgi:fructose 1,6-bisphosphate aldolase/phosphatase